MRGCDRKIRPENHRLGSESYPSVDSDWEGQIFLFHPHTSNRFFFLLTIKYHILSYDVDSGSEITPCNKIDKPLVVYRFTGNVMKSITTLRT